MDITNQTEAEDEEHESDGDARDGNDTGDGNEEEAEVLLVRHKQRTQSHDIFPELSQETPGAISQSPPHVPEGARFIEFASGQKVPLVLTLDYIKEYMKVNKL